MATKIPKKVIDAIYKVDKANKQSMNNLLIIRDFCETNNLYEANVELESTIVNCLEMGVQDIAELIVEMQDAIEHSQRHKK